ncbi:MAG TPA: hypothetical protein IAC82_09025 [Candidatus Merdivicinus intestinigallinarum]|nr:hypothetical protein [Candidatus Merdivicinus intestinigallinarum]
MIFKEKKIGCRMTAETMELLLCFRKYYAVNELENSKIRFCKAKSNRGDIRGKPAGLLFFFLFAPEARRNWISLVATSEKGLCPLHPCKLLKKLDQNF